MPKFNNHFYFGTLTKSLGLKGEMVIKNLNEDADLSMPIEFVFLEINKQLTPFFVEQISFRKKGEAVVKIQDIDSIERCAQYLKNDLYLPNEFLLEVDDEIVPFKDMIGYKAVDKLHGEIGVIKNILSYPQQEIFEIHFNGKEILIPANEDFIAQLDAEKKILYLNAPPGLIDLYLNDSKKEEEE